MNETSLTRMLAATEALRERKQHEIADLIQTAAEDLQEAHRKLLAQTQTALQGSAPALTKSAESIFRSYEGKLAGMTNEFARNSERMQMQALSRIDTGIEERVRATQLGEKLVRTIKQELPQDLRKTARNLLIEEAGPGAMRIVQMTTAGLLVGILILMSVLVLTAWRTKAQILNSAEELAAIRTELSQQAQILQHSTMGIRFTRTETGIALKLPDNLIIRQASVSVRNPIFDRSRENLWLIEER